MFRTETAAVASLLRENSRKDLAARVRLLVGPAPKPGPAPKLECTPAMRRVRDVEVLSLELRHQILLKSEARVSTEREP